MKENFITQFRIFGELFHEILELDGKIFDIPPIREMINSYGDFIIDSIIIDKVVTQQEREEIDIAFWDMITLYRHENYTNDEIIEFYEEVRNN